MGFRWQQWLVVLTMTLLLMVGVVPAAPAFPLASLHTYHERPHQTTFRSRQSFRDRTDRAWQAVLFKRYDDTTLQGLYLRVVGFPGIVDIDPTRPLQIVTGTTLQWQAKPALDAQTPALPTNAAQYDVQSIFQLLAKDIPLELVIPLQNSRTATVVVPPYGVREWRQVTHSTP